MLVEAKSNQGVVGVVVRTSCPFGIVKHGIPAPTVTLSAKKGIEHGFDVRQAVLEPVGPEPGQLAQQGKPFLCRIVC